MDTTDTSTQWWLYPPPLPIHYKPGETFYFRPKSAKEKGRRGRIMERKPDGERFTVQFESNNTTNKTVSRKRLVPVFRRSESSCVTLIVTAETMSYRHLAASQVNCSADKVLEIGCSTGEASAILTRYASSWVGFDTSNDMVAQCRARLPPENSSAAARMDLLCNPLGAKRFVQSFIPNGPSAIFVDIGGNRDLNSVLHTTFLAVTTFSPRLVVIKSRELARALPSSCGIGDDGRVPGAGEWFRLQVEKVQQSRSLDHIIAHPLQAPMVLSPLDESAPICRYHNFSYCKKGDECPFDHIHCHQCRQRGHIARNCGVDETEA